MVAKPHHSESFTGQLSSSLRICLFHLINILIFIFANLYTFSSMPALYNYRDQNELLPNTIHHILTKRMYIHVTWSHIVRAIKHHDELMGPNVPHDMNVKRPTVYFNLRKCDGKWITKSAPTMANISRNGGWRFSKRARCATGCSPSRNSTTTWFSRIRCGCWPTLRE